MKRLPQTVVILSLALFLIALTTHDAAGAVGDRLDVRIDGFVFEPGSTVALELVSSPGAPCFGDDLLVQAVELADAKGATLWSVVYETLVFRPDWLVWVALRASDGTDLPPSTYEIRVLTSAGTFTAGLRVVPAVQFASLDRFVAGVPLCDNALRVYRALSDPDQGAEITLRIGDRVMVVLAGNPTTGYAWSPSPLYGFEPIQASSEDEYRVTSTLLGGGGLFIYRYWAVREGSQTFFYRYARAWEDVGPISSFAFIAHVR